jgi:hypothetical protein
MARASSTVANGKESKSSTIRSASSIIARDQWRRGMGPRGTRCGLSAVSGAEVVWHELTRVVLREDVGYGVTAGEVLHVWLPDAEAVANFAILLGRLIEWRRDRWSGEREEHLGKPARSHHVDILGPDGKAISRVEIDDMVGRIVHLSVENRPPAAARTEAAKRRRLRPAARPADRGRPRSDLSGPRRSLSPAPEPDLAIRPDPCGRLSRAPSRLPGRRAGRPRTKRGGRCPRSRRRRSRCRG